MVLAPGTRLGACEIIAPLGAGGMGEVYRALDAKLNRSVAVKILAPALAGDEQYMARFTREAQVLASLNHPNIAQIYGLEESDGIRALVMELVEGPTLADRLAAGRLPLDDAMSIAKQIAEALEAAHEKGIVHRDLKPANVKITPDGVVKVLDFGLAKAAEASAVSSASSPTLTMRATQAGVVMGTASYMAPEQAAGKPVDKRADIWSFGVVLWEMLTGRPLFSGETVSHTLADVLRAGIDVSQLPAGTPKAIAALLRRCLDRDVKRRLRDIGEARIVLEGPFAQDSPEAARRRNMPWIAAAAIAAVCAIALAFVHLREALPAERVLQFLIEPPDKGSIYGFEVSPDGTHVAFALTVEGKRRLWVRALDSLTSQALPGTDEAMFPFWSPDGRSIGYFAQGSLKRIALSGGPSQTLCSAADGRGGTWNPEGVIVFASTNTGGLQRVPAAGGIPAALTHPERDEIHRFPLFLPDGKNFLYLVSGGTAGQRGIYVASLDSKAPRRLLPDQSSVQWLPPAKGTDKGYLIFVRESMVMAQPFDSKSLVPDGELFPVLEEVAMGPHPNHPQISISNNGVLVHLGPRPLGERQLTWYDRSGKKLGELGEPSRSRGFALSPDEKSVAFVRSEIEGGNSDLWVYDIARGTETRLTFHKSRNFRPLWSPDSRRLVYASNRIGEMGIYVMDTRGGGKEDLLLKSNDTDASRVPSDWSLDGQFLLYSWRDSASPNGGLWTVPAPGAGPGDRKPVLFLNSEFNEAQGKFSPDTHWIAYSSNESKRYEVYVRPFPAAEGRWRISTQGGQMPVWRRNGTELFYISPDRKLMAVRVKGNPGPPPTFEAAPPQELFGIRHPSFVPGPSQMSTRWRRTATGSSLARASAKNPRRH